MILDLFETTPDYTGITIDADAAQLELPGDEFFIDGPVRVELALNRSEDIVHVVLNARATFVLECVRCLERFRQNIEGTVSFVVRRLKIGETIPETMEEGKGLDEEGLIFLKYNERSIDITDFVRDAVILSVPVKPICAEQCRGICPICGQNKNVGDCTCAENRPDPRWQSLSKLIKKNFKR